ncbi:uncharacterized protein LOC101897130 [Musca domestica]|uniref:Uncharacterized protein LOC101897130 n=1 Tax=Musca domestica TaxID=7370 RepID=A0A1I8MDN8_MUSDO|nr:uncharacterized protein LOC101897130 [Musca domestica]
MPMHCAVADHELVDGCFVEDPRHIKFIKKNFIDFRPRSQICRTCKAGMEYMYELTIQKIKKKRNQSAHDELSSVSSLQTLRRSRSLSLQSNVSNDSIDDLLTKTPAHQSLNKSSSITNGSVGAKPTDVESTPYIRSVLVPLNGQDSPQSASVRRISKEVPAFTPNQLNVTEQIVFTPTVYTEDTPAAPPVARRIMGQDANNNMNSSTSNSSAARRIMVQEANKNGGNESTSHIRLSQEPTTSKAAAVAAPKLPIQEKAKGITKYFQPSSKTANNNNVQPLHGKTPTPSSVQSSPSNVRVSQEPTTSRNAANVEPLYGNTPADNSEEPETSAAIEVTPKKKHVSFSTNRKRVHHLTVDDDESVEDDDEMRSLHAFDGTRMPNVQPIIKRSRQQFTHPDYRVMDVYIADTSGG